MWGGRTKKGKIWGGRLEEVNGEKRRTYIILSAINIFSKKENTGK